MGYWVRTRYGTERYATESQLNEDFQLKNAVVLRENVILKDGKLVEESSTKTEKSSKTKKESKTTKRSKAKSEPKEEKLRDRSEYWKQYYARNAEKIKDRKNKLYRRNSRLYRLSDYEDGKTIKDGGAVGRNRWLLARRKRKARDAAKNFGKVKEVNNFNKTAISSKSVKKQKFQLYKKGEEFKRIRDSFQRKSSGIGVFAGEGVGVKAHMTSPDNKIFQDLIGWKQLNQNVKVLRVTTGVVYNYFVEDYIPYDSEREDMSDKIYDNGSKSLINKFKQVSSKTKIVRDTGKRGFKNTKVYQRFKKAVNPRTQAQEYADKYYKGNYFKRKKFMEAYDDVPHTINSVLVDETGLTWRRPNAEYIYRMSPNNKYQQKYPTHRVKRKRGSYWNERFLSGKGNIDAIKWSLQAIFTKSLRSGEDPQDIAIKEYWNK